MEEIFEIFSQKPKFAIKGDFVDSLHSKRTVIIFLAFAFLIAFKQFDDAGAIACWLSTSLSGDQIKYVHQLCWVNSTYYFPGIEDPDDFQHERRFAIPYYQFILFILVGQAFSFYLPNWLWTHVSRDSAAFMNSVLEQIDLVKHLTSMAEREKERVEAEKKEKLESRTDSTKTPSKSSRVDLTQAEPDASREPLLRNEVRKDSTAKDSEQRVNLLGFEGLSSVGSDARRHPDLMSEFGQQTFNELEDAFVPLRQMRLSSRAHRKEQIERTRARSRSGSLSKQRVRQTAAQPEPEQKKPPESVKKGLADLRKKIRRPIDAVRNLTAFYLVYKCVNLVNIVVQFFLLSFIFGEDFYTFGIQFINRVFVNTDANIFSTKQFPILTFCDFFVHQNLRQIHFNTAQCLLHINVYIEKFYIVIWFWLVFLFVVTLLNIISWIIEIFFTSTGFLIKYLSIKEKILSAADPAGPAQSNYLKYDTFKEQVGQFKQEFLGHDGILMMQMIKNISGPIWFMDILHSAWIKWKKEKEEALPPVDSEQKAFS